MEDVFQRYGNILTGLYVFLFPNFFSRFWARRRQSHEYLLTALQIFLLEYLHGLLERALALFLLRGEVNIVVYCIFIAFVGYNLFPEVLSQPTDKSSFFALLAIVLYQVLVFCEGLCRLGWVVSFVGKVKPLG